MLESLLTPNAIAVIGVSRSPGKVGYEIFANLIESGFEGAIVPINPTATEILDRPCYQDLRTYGKKIELSVIALPTKLVRQAVQDSIQARPTPQD